MPEARRFTTFELGPSDLRAPDPRIVWATAARASSEWSASYAASEACGEPRVFPNGGDEHHTWLAQSSDLDPWIEVELPAVESAAALIVCETCGPGAVHEIRDVDRDAVLFSSKPEAIEPSREARLLYVPLDGPPPRKVRLAVARYDFGSEYHEIDAVGLLREPIERLQADPPGWGPIRHERHAPRAVAELDLSGDPRIRWAKGARASSEYSSSYSASKAVGPPRVFPRGGDIENTWLPRGRGHDEWIELSFDVDGLVHGLVVLETCGAGAVYKITDEHGTLLFCARPEKVPERKARLLHVPLDAIAAPRTVRLWLSADVEDYREIDAVALLTAPFDTLDQPPPPPGSPSEGWSTLEGRLLDAVAAPFVHAVLRTPKEGRAINHGGPLRLRLPSGDEVTLETGRTTIFGGRLTRARGTWAECRERAPWLTAGFGDPPSDDTRVELEGRRLDAEIDVVVIGEATETRAEGGFREPARAVPERFDAAAICVETREVPGDFEAHGTDCFDRGAHPIRRAEPAPHPLAGWTLGMSIVTLVAVAALLMVHASGADAPFGLALFVLICFTGAHALELWARMRWIPAFLVRPEASVMDEAVPFTRPMVEVVAGATVLVMGGIVLALPTFLIFGDDGGPRLAALAGVLYALFRAALWLRVAAAPLWRALPVALARRGVAAPGGAGRFSGLLGAGELRRSERYAMRGEHLGSYTTTDSQGNTVARNQYRTWYERKIRSRGPSTVSIVLDDDREVRATGDVRTTDVGLECRPTSGLQDIGHFESLHREGDPATLVGEVLRIDDGGIELRATHLVLGPFGELRRRVAVQLFVLAALTALVAAGVHLAVRG